MIDTKSPHLQISRDISHLRILARGQLLGSSEVDLVDPEDASTIHPRAKEIELQEGKLKGVYYHQGIASF